MTKRIVSMKSLFRHKAQLMSARTSGRNDEKVGRPSQRYVIFVVMDALENVLVGEVLILHCHQKK